VFHCFEVGNYPETKLKMGSEHLGVSNKNMCFSQQLNKIQNFNTDWKNIVWRKYKNGNYCYFYFLNLLIVLMHIVLLSLCPHA